MRPSRWQSFGTPVWNQLHQLQAEMNHLFDRWGHDGRRLLGLAAYPPVNVWEDGDALHVESELPGLNLGDLEIYVTGGNQLTLKGKRQQVAPEKGVWHREERTFGEFSRVLTLPYPVDADKVDARFDNGVLHVLMPKAESARARKIVVKSSE
jgi:HSP20 family protein